MPHNYTYYKRESGELMSIVLISGDGSTLSTSKRIKYFLEAAEAKNVSVNVIPYPSIEELNSSDTDFFNALQKNLQGKRVKLDPPTYTSSDISDIYVQIAPYIALWKQIAKIPNIQLLNSVEAIIQTLDKLYCKQILMQAGVPCTSLLTLSPNDASDVKITNIAKLRKLLISKGLNSAFIKPRWGSGAAGVMGYKISPNFSAKRELLCTSAIFENGKLHNTKQLRNITNPTQIEAIINQVLNQGAVIEQWLPKAKIDNNYFDLRVVYQFGKISFIVARQSASHITNLHLNNSPLDISLLQEQEILTSERIKEIETICTQATKLFSGLNVAGIDILLEPNTYKPHIIEINAQGDLIYQDILSKNAENKIYKEQIR